MGFPVFEIQFEPMKATRQGAERRGGETVSRAIEWLEPKRRGGNPFFLLVHLFDPHQPYDPPPPFQAEFRGNPYGGEVAYCDSLIGSLLGRLEQQDLLNSTIVAVVSDHGEAFHEHEEVGHGFLLYETTMRVPWIMAGPQIPAASIEGTARLIDVAPTLMGACGLKIPAMFQGDNLMSELAVAAAGSTIRLSERPTYFETYYPRMTHHWSELLGWRDGPWKYIRGPRPELFNLERDPDEALDLYHQERAKAAELSAAMDDYLQRSSPYRLSPLAEAPDAETMEKLRSLGYLGGSTPERAIERPGWECGLPDPKDAIGAWNLRQEANAFLRIALVQFQAGQFEKALEWADRSLASDESRMDALMVRAKSLAALNRLDEAHDSFEKLLRHQPEDAAAWSGFGIVQDRLGRPARAEEAFVKSIELDSTLSDAHFNMGSLLIRQGRIREAVPYYEAVRRLQPEDASLRADLARLYMSLEKVQDMESVLEEGYATDPRHPGILLLLAQLRIHQGNLGEGRQLLERYLELYPERPDAPEVRTLLASLGDES
ncbi:MAG: sulfatase-like hydrolase/transferase [Candidatus Eisenbacteria bacterium]|nr:sulfatase-like hydrolase/transferase [Candidatus Eisenbacteria bacterium]